MQKLIISTWTTTIQVKNKEFIIYLDANNLYGWAMSQPLAIGNFIWMNSTEDFDVMSIPNDGPQGYILEADLG